MKSLISRDFSTKNLKMDFFDLSDGIHSDSDFSDSDDDNSISGQHQREEDINLRDGIIQHNLPQKNDWTFESFSNRGSDYIGNQKSKIDPILESFKVGYNTIDTMLLSKALLEINQILSLVRKTIYLFDNKQNLSPFSCFAALVPDQLFLSFRQWIIEGLGSKTFRDERYHFTLSEIVVFFRCEIIMMQSEISSNGLMGKISKDDFHIYKKIRDIITKADLPASSRKVDTNIARLPAFSMDPIVINFIGILNRHWCTLFYVPTVTWVDLDDEKLPFSSKSWKSYGYRMMTTKEKKQKPVYHCMASVSTACLIWIHPEKIGMKQSEMLKEAITSLCPHGKAALRSNITFFIDRGYLEISKNQNKDNVTNLVQLMLHMGVKFLGTLKNTEAFPFHIEDVNVKRETNLNNKVIVQSYGTRSAFESHTKVGGIHKVKVVVIRHGTGRMRCVRIGTNIPFLMTNRQWVFETTSGCKGQGQVARNEHFQSGVHVITSRKCEKHNRAWVKNFSTVYQMTKLQRTQDWFLCRMFRFTSTTFHSIINIRKCVFIDTVPFQVLHTQCKNIVQLYPTVDITTENASVYEDNDLNECRLSSALHSTSDIQSKQTTDPKYYMNKYDKNGLVTLAKDKYGIQIENASKKILSLAIIEKEIEIISNEDDTNASNNTKETSVIPKIKKQKAFLQRLMPHWFMKPFKTKDGDAIETGIHNENFVISSMKGYLRSISDDKYNIGKIVETGLLINRKVQISGTSPDGIMELYQNNGKKKWLFLGLCVLEIKTRNTVTTATKLDYDIAKIGCSFKECYAGGMEFRTYVPEPAYRSQISQHACVTGLNFALIAYSIPGGLIKRIVLVRYKTHMLTSLLSYQDEMRKQYMNDFYSDEKSNNLQIQSIGEDYDNVYGYAQEHHTVELYMRLWKRHSDDVIANGTPPTIKKVIESSCSTWNKCMGNVDIVRKTLGNHKTKRGNNTKPGFLTWYTIFQYILYNTFRVYTYSLLEKKLNSINSFMQLQDRRKHVMSFKEFLSRISARDSFCITEFEKYYPGLREKFDRSMRGEMDEKEVVISTSTENEGSARDGKTILETLQKYKKMELFNDKSTIEYSTRLDNSLLHALSANMEFNSKGTRRARLHCVMCCVNCLKEEGQDFSHPRVGRTTTKFCPICKVVLCIHCFQSFHTDETLKVPQCVQSKMSLHVRNKILTKTCVTAPKVKDQISTPSLFVKKRKTMYKNSNSVSTHSSIKKRKIIRNKRLTSKVNHLKDDQSIRNVEVKQKSDSSDDSIENTPILHKMDPTEAQLIVDLNPVSLFANKDDKSKTDASYCVHEGTIKNPDDDGEGDNVKHSEDLVGIKNTVIPKVINIKPEPADTNTKNYLRRFNRRTSSIPNHFLNTIEKYGSIQNVKPDGNCGFYSVMNGLAHIGIPYEEDLNLHRKIIYDYIDDNRTELFWLENMVWRNRDKNDYINKEILTKCWEAGKDFTDKCPYEYWLEANKFFPIMAKYYKCNFIWYDVQQNITKACVSKMQHGKPKDVILSKNKFVPPKSMCENSIWKLRVICIYFESHFMCLKEYLKLE